MADGGRDDEEQADRTRQIVHAFASLKAIFDNVSEKKNSELEKWINDRIINEIHDMIISDASEQDKNYKDLIEFVLDNQDTLPRTFTTKLPNKVKSFHFKCMHHFFNQLIDILAECEKEKLSISPETSNTTGNRRSQESISQKKAVSAVLRSSIGLIATFGMLYGEALNKNPDLDFRSLVRTIFSDDTTCSDKHDAMQRLLNFAEQSTIDTQNNKPGYFFNAPSLLRSLRSTLTIFGSIAQNDDVDPASLYECVKANITTQLNWNSLSQLFKSVDYIYLGHLIKTGLGGQVVSHLDLLLQQILKFSSVYMFYRKRQNTF